MISDTSRADADRRHQAGLPGGGRFPGDDVPPPAAARAAAAQAAADAGPGAVCDRA